MIFIDDVFLFVMINNYWNFVWKKRDFFLDVYDDLIEEVWSIKIDKNRLEKLW